MKELQGAIIVHREGNIPDPLTLAKNGTPIKRGRYREVWRCDQLILKITKTPTLFRKLKLTAIPGRRNREVKNSIRLIEAGFKTPRPLMWGYRKNGIMLDCSFVVFQFIEGEHPGEDTLTKIAQLLGRMNRMGIFPLDPHPENFMLSHGEIYLLDTYYISFSKALGNLLAVKALSKLLLPLFLDCKKEMLSEAIHLYNVSSGKALKREVVINTLAKLAREKTKKAGRLSLKNRGKTPKLEGTKSTLLKRSSKSETVRVENVVIKRFHPVILRRTRGEKAWAGLHMLRRYGIPSPFPLALEIEGKMRRKSTLYMGFVEGIDLETFLKLMWDKLRAGDKILMTRKLARFLGSLYVRSIFHGDLKGKNILWNGREFILLDPEAIKCKKITRRDVLKNLIQLEKSISRKVAFSYKYVFLKDLSCFLLLLGILKDKRKGTKDIIKNIKRTLYPGEI